MAVRYRRQSTLSPARPHQYPIDERKGEKHMKKIQIATAIITALMLLSLVLIQAFQPAYAANWQRENFDYQCDATWTFNNRAWDVWVSNQTASNKSIVIALFGGSAYAALTTTKPLQKEAEYNFITQLCAKGIDVITLNASNAAQPPIYAASTYWNSWLASLGNSLKNNYNYSHVFLFGHSAGGVDVAYEIQNQTASKVFDAAVIASAPVNYDAYSNDSLYQTADSAENVTIRTCFICNMSDGRWLPTNPPVYTSIYAQMQTYYNNTKAPKEIHNWNGTNGDAHSGIFNATCLSEDHGNETLAETVYNWFMQPTVELTVEAYNQNNQPGNGIAVYIDGKYVGTTFSTFNVTHGNHQVEVANPLLENYYSFSHYTSEGLKDMYSNPVEFWAGSNRTVTAFYIAAY